MKRACVLVLAVVAMAACSHGGHVPDVPAAAPTTGAAATAAPTTAPVRAAAVPACTALLAGTAVVDNRGADTDIKCLNGSTLVVAAGFQCPDGNWVFYNDLLIWRGRDNSVKPKGTEAVTIEGACS